MSTTMVVDHRAPKSRAADPSTNMAAHLIAVTALSMAIAKMVASNADAAEFDQFACGFSAQSEKLAAQYSAAAVRQRAAEITADVLHQLRDIHDQKRKVGG